MIESSREPSCGKVVFTAMAIPNLIMSHKEFFTLIEPSMIRHNCVLTEFSDACDLHSDSE